MRNCTCSARDPMLFRIVRRSVTGTALQRHVVPLSMCILGADAAAAAVDDDAVARWSAQLGCVCDLAGSPVSEASPCIPRLLCNCTTSSLRPYSSSSASSNSSSSSTCPTHLGPPDKLHVLLVSNLIIIRKILRLFQILPLFIFHHHHVFFL